MWCRWFFIAAYDHYFFRKKCPGVRWKAINSFFSIFAIYQMSLTHTQTNRESEREIQLIWWNLLHRCVELLSQKNAARNSIEICVKLEKQFKCIRSSFFRKIVELCLSLRLDSGSRNKLIRISPAWLCVFVRANRKGINCAVWSKLL